MTTSSETGKGDPGSGAAFGPAPSLPTIPGADERDERHPFGYLDDNDPDHESMTKELKPSTLLNMICLAGCRHYAELIDEEPTADPQEWKAVHRICRHFHDDEGEWDITEQTMYACSEFAPHPLNVIGQGRRVLNWCELKHASGIVNSGYAATNLSTFIATTAVEVLSALGVDLKRKLIPEIEDEEGNEEKENDE